MDRARGILRKTPWRNAQRKRGDSAANRHRSGPHDHLDWTGCRSRLQPGITERLS